MQGTPNIDTLKQYMVNRPGQVEVVRNGLYDTALYATAGSTSIPFFSTPIGQGLSSAPGNTNAVKNIVDTNMSLAGQLPAGQSYLVEAVEVDFVPGSSAAANTFALVNPIVFAVAAAAGTVWAAISDVHAIYRTGALTFNVGSKNYLQEGPLGKFPPSAHVEVKGDVTSTSATVGQTAISMAYAEGKPYNIIPISLVASQNFNVTASWPVAVATPSGFNGALRVTLVGYQYRNSQ
jgi:hypothetical protein